MMSQPADGDIMKNENRETNYDLLRVISAIAVVMIHVSASWIHPLTDMHRLQSDNEITEFRHWGG